MAAVVKSDIERATLRIGDYVLLKDVNRNSFLSVEGILQDDVIAYEGTDNLFDCIFCVHLQRQYSASRDLSAFLANYNNDVKSIVEESAKKYLLALQRGRENEKKLNDSYMKKKFGQKVAFGDIIQLYHLKSKKYLTVLPDKLAKDERENTRISLDAIGNSYSWLQLAPRFRIDKEGDRVLSNAEMYLKVAERVNEYIHTADRDPLPGSYREVNCALESTSWKLCIYQSSAEFPNPSLLMVSQLVLITDPETKGNLSILQKTSNLLYEEDHDREEDEEVDQTEDHDNEDDRFAHEFGDIILSPTENDEINSNFLWIIDSQSLINGGPIAWKTEAVRFRHMNSGKYLQLIVEPTEDDSEELERIFFTATLDPEDPGTIFNINDLNAIDAYVNNAKPVQFGQNGIWLERGEILEDSVFNYIIKGTKDKTMALSLIIQRYDGSSKAGKIDTESSGDSNLEPLDVYTGLSIRRFISRYNELIIVPRSEAINTVLPNSFRYDLDFLKFVADKTVYFSQGFAISTKYVELGIDKGDNQLLGQRQRLLREQGTLDQVIEIIQKLIPMTDRLERIKANKNKRKKDRVSDEEMTAINMAQLILTKAFEIIYYSILDNPQNQLYVADFMPVLLAHLNCKELAGKCVTEMLSKNMDLQETKIGTREIQIFVDKLRSSKMNAMYLNLLTSCCSCEGDGVDGNQTKVATMLFSDTNDIIINLHADFARLNRMEWTDQSLYIPATPIPGSPLRAENLITKGLPQLSLAWTTNSIDYSPLGLFGRLSVNIEELFPPKAVEEAERKSMKNSKQKMKKKSTEEQKKAVADYFIAEMKLGAEMCLDRNYIAMHKLDDLFPYEVLVTILKLNVSDNLKAAAVRLLMCLHVDRDPQAASKIPCLTRTWSDIKKNEEPQLPFVDPSRRYMFGLIQQLISEHIREMAGSSWNELSRHMLKMLKTLIQFNFYGTTDRMQDVIKPLLTALDRRNMNALQADILPEIEEVQDKPEENDPPSPSKTLAGEEMKEEEKIPEYLDMTSHLSNNEEQDDFVPWHINLWSRLQSLTTSLFSGNYQSMDNNGLLEDQRARIEGFASPLRYTKAPIHELETMVEAVDILAFTQRVIEDRNISLFLRYFYAWESSADSRSPQELFEQVVLDAAQLSLGNGDFDNIMIDTLMFVHTPLVQSTLEVLMAHHSMRRILLDNAKNVQLLASHRRERQFRMVDQMLQQLEQNAETQELWGELETDADQAINKQTQDILRELIDMCRVRRYVLEFDEDYMADREIQDLYRNLGCFEICMKVMGLLDSVEEDEDGEIGEAGLNTKSLCLLCNELLYWFFLGNTKNQEMGYLELDFFLDTLDDEINSHLTIRAIFNDNEDLMRQVPHIHLSNLVDRIVKDGKSHHYLSLFAAIPNVGEKNIVENQFEIVKMLTSPGRLQKIGCFLFPISDPRYEEKRQLMLPLKGQNKLTMEDLPPLLAYHLVFLNVLSGCTVGRMNVTTVEAKVQSVFGYVDIIDSILDEDTILLAKISLARFLFNAVIEVEMLIPGLEKSPSVWKLLDSFVDVIKKGKNDLLHIEEDGWDSPFVSRQEIEYLIICIYIIKGFFSTYFDISAFKPDTNKKGSKFKLTSSHINQLIVLFFHKIKDIYDLNCSRLSSDVKRNILECLEVLKSQASKYIHLSADQSITPNRKTDFIHVDLDKSKCITSDDIGEVGSPGKAKDPSELKLIKHFNDFLSILETDTQIQYKAENENVAFIKILEALPFIADPVDADVRYETLIKKLVFHIRENIKTIDNQKRMDARVAKTSSWIIRAFRTMIENRMGMSIYERDDDGGLEQDIAAAPVVNALNSCGATALCLDLIAVGIDEKLQLEAIKLGVALLFKEGGALEVQQIMNNHLNKTNSELFFKQVRLTLQKLQAWHSWNQVIILPEGEEPKPPDEILIVRFLQLMCEGHYLPNQDIMREQSHNPVSYNLLDDFVNYLNCLSRIPCRTSTVAGIRLAATILEVIQGPCEGNQVHFALNTELIETLNRLNRAKMINDCVEDEEIELKQISIDIFQGLLEGQGEKSVVYERVLSVIHLDIIQMMSKGLGMVGDIIDVPDDVEMSDDKIALQTECIVLLQMLCNFKPSLYDELGISRNVEDIVGSGTAMIEIVWRGDIHRRFFHVPKVCQYLAKSSKDALVENVDRSNPENKLIDFLARSHDLYREVKHQQYLTEMGLARIFSRENQNRATWITFLLAIVINGLFIAYYKNDSGGKPEVLNKNALLVINILNYLQSAVAAFVLVLSIVVRSPVIYQSLAAEGHSTLNTILYTAADPRTCYYFLYLLLSLLGLFLDNYYLPFLLLDIVAKNATTRDVLNAVVIPRLQLVMTMLLALFINFIFAYFYFKNFSDNIGGIWGVGVFPGNDDCRSLWGCFKFVLCYGVRQGGGVGDVMNLSIGTQWLADLSYFLIVIIMLLNIVFGIIIDTFSSLRADKLEKLENTLEVCFICSIDKQTFDRASDEPDGFQTHIKLDHNMWNYMYYIFMLWEQDRDDDDGLEQYVRRAIEADEIIWFPLNKAIRLDQAATEEEETLEIISKKLDSYESALSQKLNSFHAEISAMLEQLSAASKQSYTPGAVKSGISQFLKEYSTKDVAQEEAIDLASEVPLLEDEDQVKDLDDSFDRDQHGDEAGDEGDDDDQSREGDTHEDESHSGFRPSWLEKSDVASTKTSEFRRRLDSKGDDTGTSQADNSSIADVKSYSEIENEQSPFVSTIHHDQNDNSFAGNELQSFNCDELEEDMEGEVDRDNLVSSDKAPISNQPTPRDEEAMHSSRLGEESLHTEEEVNVPEIFFHNSAESSRHQSENSQFP